MLDLELLNTLVCVVDERSFSRAAQRVHRTQSTVSQQVLKLESRLGQQLLMRDRTGRNVVPTEEGERLANYARRLLALAREAEAALAKASQAPPIRVGVPEDFDTHLMAGILSGVIALRPNIRLETVSGMSVDLQRGLEQGETDIALVKREPRSAECVACWPERLVWVTSSDGPPHEVDCVPLALFPQGCIYRQRAIHALEVAGRAWRISFGSHSLAGIQAAVSCGLGVTVLPEVAMLESHSVLSPRDGYPDLPASELALVVASRQLNREQRAVAQLLATEVEKAMRIARPRNSRRRARDS